jgi:hypothetical protein
MIGIQTSMEAEKRLKSRNTRKVASGHVAESDEKGVCKIGNHRNREQYSEYLDRELEASFGDALSEETDARWAAQNANT